MTNWIHVDDAYSQFVQASLNAMRSDVDQERTWLLSTKRPIQPDGQVWPVAVALVDAWDRWLSRREQWYAQRSASNA